MSTRHRVVITGMGLRSPIGASLDEVALALRSGRSGVRYMAEWEGIDGLNTRLSAPLSAEPDPSALPRTSRRSMGRQAVVAALAALDAVAHAGLPDALVRSGSVGLAVGSTLGSPSELYDFYAHLIGQQTFRGVRGTTFLKLMGHTCAANLAQLLGVSGRVLAPVSACTSGSQGIGCGFEAIRDGHQDVMICGGADEAHFTAAATFDLVGGASTAFHDRPEDSPRPFDAARDGLVVGEGAGIVVLERLEHAQARGATIHAEVLSYVTTCDGGHITQPSAPTMEATMRAALTAAGLQPADLGYINAHATATPLGDVVEAQATRAVFGDRVPVSSTKGQTGHTLGACGGLETIFCVLALRDGLLPATRNLIDIDEACRGLDHVTTPREAPIQRAMNNNFAFGGVNTSLVLGRV